jgi:hypothetical protein
MNMISVKESFERIKIYFLDVFGTDITDIRLEEIREGTDEEYHLTVSFLIPNKNIPETIAGTLRGMVNPYIRQYKNIAVNKSTGDIISVKIHKDA